MAVALAAGIEQCSCSNANNNSHPDGYGGGSGGGDVVVVKSHADFRNDFDEYYCRY